MGQEQDIKIRTLPRSTDKKPSPEKPKSPPRWIIYVGLSAIALLTAVILIPAHGPHRAVRHLDLSSVQDPVNARVNNLMRDSLLKEEMLKQKREMENLRAQTQVDDHMDAAVLPDNTHTYGVQLNQDDTSDRLYNDLDTHPDETTDWLPDDRISARLAKRKWLSEEEKAERIQFVRNFIRSAYDRGYEVQIDQNLVVVGVHKMTGVRHVDIDKVIDKMALEGL